MKEFWMIVIICVILGNFTEGKVVGRRFPRRFIFGTGSSAYQIEGAWNVSDKGESVCDRWTHDNLPFVTDGSNGNIACDSYHKYKEDVQNIKSIGLDFYRFSISWSRVLPDGLTNMISKDGLQYYKNLTAELVANGIQPVVTLHHMDHPQFLEEMGGWTNELMVDWFVSYARVIFKALGKHVKIWITINEPNFLCNMGYRDALLAPGKMLNGVGTYLCMHNVLKAHAKTYHMYNKEFRPTQKGEIGILPQCSDYVAANSSDTESVETAFQFNCGWVVHPIYFGDYPEIMKSRIAMVSKAQRYEKSRLPEFSDEWKSMIKGSADYFGVNHYTSVLVSPDPAEKLGIYNGDDGLITSQDESLPEPTEGWRVSPKGFGDLLRKIKKKYHNPRVRVMEHGYPDSGESDDYKRISYHHDCLKELLIAIKKNDCNVKSYAAWGLMDDFEWAFGYSLKFGMFSVDFNNTDRLRTPKRSATWWKSVCETRRLQPIDNPISKLCRSRDHSQQLWTTNLVAKKIKNKKTLSPFQSENNLIKNRGPNPEGRGSDPGRFGMECPKYIERECNEYEVIGDILNAFRSLCYTQAGWIAKAKEWQDWFVEQENVLVNERLRPGPAVDKDSIFGFSGSFRKLDVD